MRLILSRTPVGSRIELLIIPLLLISQLHLTNSFVWEDDDSIIIEGSSSVNRRSARFPFTWPWTNENDSGNRGRSESSGQISDSQLVCYTSLSEEGRCASLRDCYPMLYSVEYAGGKEASTLIETLKSISGPCEMPLFNKFRIDMPDSLICCPSRLKPTTEIPILTFYKTTTRKRKPTTIKTTIKPTPSTKKPTERPSAVYSPSTKAATSTEVDLNSTTEVVVDVAAFIKLESNSTNAENVEISTVKTTTKKPTTVRTTTLPPIPDAVAAFFYREPVTCGSLENMSSDDIGKRFPWIVALVGNRGHFCAGTLIDSYYVLTSASCVSHMSSEDVSNLQVFLGDYKLNTMNDGPSIIRKVSRVIYHSGYDNQTLENDIALLRFKLPAPIGTPRVQPICLPSRIGGKKKTMEALVGVEGILAGWGRTWNPSPVPTLQNTKMIIWNNDECRAKYGYLARNGVSDHMLCAYPPQNDKNNTGEAKGEEATKNKFRRVKIGSSGKKISVRREDEVRDCVGDGGGPLVVKKSERRYEIVGIVSWNIGCSHYPYIHTRVSSYLNWIEKNRRH